MSYTTFDHVRMHLVTPHPVTDTVKDQALVLTGVGFRPFFSGAVDPDSVRVKARLSGQPIRTAVTLAQTPVAVTAAPLVPASVVVASDSSLGTIYTEQTDYLIDCTQATITPTASGRLSAGQTVTVWYLTYTVLTAGEDFALNAGRGEIRRLAAGAIPDGATVWLDYVPLSTALDDSLVDHAVLLANGMIESDLDPDRQFETDPNLTAAATHRALDIVCRAAASRELGSRQADDKTALAWLKLADHHAARCDHLVMRFRSPYPNPQSPVSTRRRPTS